MTQVKTGIAALTVSAAALRAAYDYPDLRAAVARNASCPIDLWREIYTTTGSRKLTPAEAKDIVSDQSWTTAKLEHIIATENRAQVLAKVLTQLPISWETLKGPWRKHLAKDAFASHVARMWFPSQDPNILVDVDPEELANILRAWRLTASELTDEQVIAEILHLGADLSTRRNWWPQVHIALYHRPHLIQHLGAVEGSMATLLAGSPAIGHADDAVQRNILGLDAVSPRDDLVYRCMAFAANPTASLTVVKEILSHRVAEDFNVQENVERRLRDNSWTVRTLREAAAADQQRRILRWVTPMDGKAGRPMAFAEFISNPDLAPEHVDALALAFRQREAISPLWHSREMQQALTALADRDFPEGTMVTDLVEIIDKWQTGEGWAAHRTGPPAEAEPQERSTHVNRSPNLATVGGLVYGYGLVELEESLGDDVEAWRQFLLVAEDMRDVPVEDAVGVATALAL